MKKLEEGAHTTDKKVLAKTKQRDIARHDKKFTKKDTSTSRYIVG
jgi:hypothetical protein